MREAELIAKQQLEIERLKQEKALFMEVMQNIHNSIYCIGGPLNDNYHQYNKEQRKVFWYIINELDSCSGIEL